MLQELTTHHREIARLKFEGYRAADISERLNIPVTTVRAVLSDRLCKAHIERLNEEADNTALVVRQRLAKLSLRAIDRQEDILDPASENIPWPVIASTSKDVLDRAGHAPEQKHKHLHGHFTAEDLQELKERAQKQRQPEEDPEESQALNVS